MKILCVGHITYDTTFPCTSYPSENTKNRYDEEEQCVGGPAGIGALLLGRWNENVEMAGVCGNDEYGHRIKKEFSLNRVGTEHIVLSDDAKTSHALVLANRSNGSRTIMMYVPKHVSLNPFKPKETPDIILLDGHEYKASYSLLKSYPNAISVLDAGRDKKEIVDLGKMVNYLVCSLDFAQSVTGIKADFENKTSLMNIYNKLDEMFQNNIVITLEKHGCLYKYNNQIKIMPSIKVKTIDSTGAGDIFHGAFVYGLANGFDFEKTLKFANIAGALSVTRVGGYKSIPSLEEMMEVYNEVK